MVSIVKEKIDWLSSSLRDVSMRVCSQNWMKSQENTNLSGDR
jgi:hypothetical protein